MPDRERIDPLEKHVFRLAGTRPADRGTVARILEEGARVGDLVRRPGQGVRAVTTAILVRAMRPPFKMSPNKLLGEPEFWEVED